MFEILGLALITAIVWAHIALYKRWKDLTTIEKGCFYRKFIIIISNVDWITLKL